MIEVIGIEENTGTAPLLSPGLGGGGGGICKLSTLSSYKS